MKRFNFSYSVRVLAFVMVLLFSPIVQSANLSLPTWFPKEFPVYPGSKIVKVEPWEKKGLPDVTFVIEDSSITEAALLTAIRKDLQAKGWVVGELRSSVSKRFKAVLPKQKKIVVMVIPKHHIINKYDKLAYRVKVYREAPKS